MYYYYYFGFVLIRIIRKHHDRYIDIYENATAAPSMIAKGKLEGVATARFFSSHALLRKNERKFFCFVFGLKKLISRYLGRSKLIFKFG